MTGPRRSEPEWLHRQVAHLCALGSEIIGNFVRAVGPLAGRHPEFDQPQTRAQARKPRVIAHPGHTGLEQYRRPVGIGSQHIVAGPHRCEAGRFDGAVGFIDQAKVRGIHETRCVDASRARNVRFQITANGVDVLRGRATLGADERQAGGELPQLASGGKLEAADPRLPATRR